MGWRPRRTHVLLKTFGHQRRRPVVWRNSPAFSLQPLIVMNEDDLVCIGDAHPHLIISHLMLTALVGGRPGRSDMQIDPLQADLAIYAIRRPASRCIIVNMLRSATPRSSSACTSICPSITLAVAPTRAALSSRSASTRRRWSACRASRRSAADLQAPGRGQLLAAPPPMSKQKAPRPRSLLASGKGHCSRLVRGDAARLAFRQQSAHRLERGIHLSRLTGSLTSAETPDACKAQVRMPAKAQRMAKPRATGSISLHFQSPRHGHHHSLQHPMNVG